MFVKNFMELPNFISPFLISIDDATNEMYVFHREEPQYLIWVKQEIPLRFILIEYYDNSLSTDYISAHPSLADARQFINAFIAKKGFPDVN